MKHCTALLKNKEEDSKRMHNSTSRTKTAKGFNKKHETRNSNLHLKEPSYRHKLTPSTRNLNNHMRHTWFARNSSTSLSTHYPESQSMDVTQPPPYGDCMDKDVEEFITGEYTV